MSYMDSLIGSGGKPKTISNVLNKDIASRNKTLLSDWTTTRNTGMEGLNQYVTDFYAGQPSAKARSGQEVGNMDRYFDGGASAELAGMRNRAYENAVGAGDLASKFLLRNYKSGAATQEGMPSSTYFARAVMPSLMDVQSGAALARDAAERSDWGNLEAQRLALTGRRTGVEDQLLGRSMMPYMANNQLLGSNASLLAQLGNIDTGNTMYGLKNNPGFGEGAWSDYGTVMDAS